MDLYLLTLFDFWLRQTAEVKRAFMNIANWFLNHESFPYRPFDNFRASKAVGRRFRTTVHNFCLSSGFQALKWSKERLSFLYDTLQGKGIRGEQNNNIQGWFETC